MNISFRYDGTCYAVLFSGTVDISVHAGGVAVSGASDDFKLWGVAQDAKAQESYQADLDAQKEREERLMRFGRSMFRESSCGGSKARAGYD